MSNSVLIVDDAEFMRAMLKDMVTDMGLTVVAEAADGDQAVELFEQLTPDLVLLDINLPTVDGIEALQQIIAREPDAQVVMITPLGQKEQVLRAIKAGARDFIIKPFDQERVQDTVSRILATLPVTA